MGHSRNHVDSAALATAVGAVTDPELHRPLAELGMVGEVRSAETTGCGWCGADDRGLPDAGTSG